MTATNKNCGSEAAGLFRKVNICLFRKVNLRHFLNTVKKFVEDVHFGLDEGLGLRA